VLAVGESAVLLAPRDSAGRENLHGSLLIEPREHALGRLRR